MLRSVFLASLLGATPLLAQDLPSAAQPAEPPPAFTEQVEVVAVTPVHGLGVARWKVPTNVQMFTAPRLPAEGPSDPAGVLASRAASVHVTETQAGTFQPDVLFRGFTGSPLLGSSAGLAVYQDGVRMNEPFGDTVNWDALPSTAVASINVMPGSNPLFGLNALGGAITIRTKDGFAFPGVQTSVRAGSFGRYDLEGEAGGQRGMLGYYLAGALTREEGWRQHSPSSVRRLFGDVGWRGSRSQLNVSLTAASNDLTGNGPTPEWLLERERDAVFTHPDRTDNDLGMLVARFAGRHAGGQVDAVAYYRHTHVRTFNGDQAEEEDEDDDPDEEEEEEFEFDALNNRSRTRSHGAGATLQWSRRGTLMGGGIDLVLGGSLDAAGTRFGFGSELAMLTEDRGTIGSGLFEEDAAVALRTRTTTGGVFASAIWAPADRLGLTASGRFNRTGVRLRDQLGTALSGDHAFARVNPAGGVTWQLTPAVNAYGGYTQSSRVPTPVELTCADPEDPCRLPNAFVSDPPLAQIVARTWEAGVRGAPRGISWSLSTYRTTSTDDIIFVSSGTLRGEGHFENVERTLRRGIEASVSYERPRQFSVFATYTAQRAAFGSPLIVASRFHPLASGFEIEVLEGDRLPGVPTHHVKAGVAASFGSAWSAGTVVRGQSGQFVRGDEANLLQPLPGFVLADLHVRRRLTNRLSVLLQVQNVFDARFSTFGILGDASLLDDDLSFERFSSPGAPRALALELQVGF